MFTFPALYFGIIIFCLHTIALPRARNSVHLRRDLVPGLLGGGMGSEHEKPIETQLKIPTPTSLSISDTLAHLHPEGKASLSSFSTTNARSATSTILNTRLLSTTPTTNMIQTSAHTTIFNGDSSSSIPNGSVSVSKANTPSDTRPEEMTAWKVIGIGIMSITSIGTVILLIVFFDSWWGFVRDTFSMRRQEHEGGIEKMVNDCDGNREKGWDFKLAVAKEDGHRYPTMASLESITEAVQRQNSILKSQTDVPIPSPPKRDPHPLEPLFRRPNNRPVPSTYSAKDI